LTRLLTAGLLSAGLLTRLSLTGLLTLPLLAWLVALLPLFSLTGLLSSTLRRLLQAVARGFHLGQRSLRFALILTAALTRPFRLHRGLHVFQLILQLFEALRDRLLAHPGGTPLALADEVGVVLHLQSDLVLLASSQCLTQLGRDSRLLLAHLASGVGHLALQALQIVGHFILLAGEALALIAGRSRSVLLPQSILKILLMRGELLGLVQHVVYGLSSLLLPHATQQILGFIQALGRAALSGGVLLGIATLLAGLRFAHIVGRFG
jgi:hypothetical protein